MVCYQGRRIRKLPFIIGFLLLFLCSTDLLASDNRLEQAIDRLANVDDCELGITPYEETLTRDIHSIGASAIPRVIGLLENGTPCAQKIAGYILRDMDGLTEGHLDPLIQARLRGDGWILPAIASIGTDKAIRFLIEELRKEKQTHTQLTWAFKKLGPKGVPYLVKLLDCDKNCDESLLGVVASIFGELGKNSESGIGALIGICLNSTKSPISRKWAANCLGEIGLSSDSTATVLIALRNENPRVYGQAVVSALQKMKHPSGVMYQVEKLKKTKDPFEVRLILRDIAEMGGAAQSAGPAIEKYLNHENWDVCVAAARTLGFIGCRGSISQLEELLDSPQDWQLTFVAAAALGMLRSYESREHLERISKSHWYTPVRNIAAKALEFIADSAKIPPQESGGNFAFEFFSFTYAGKDIPRCSHPSGKEGKMRLNVQNGVFVGTDKGEWGGELVFTPSQGHTYVVVEDNVNAIYQLNPGIIVVTGLAHMGTNNGMLWDVNLGVNGKWSARKICRLPGAPVSSTQGSHSEIMIDTRGGTVTFSKARGLALVECKKENH